MGFGGGCQSGRRFHFDFTSPTTGQCCAPVMETYTYLAFLAFTPAATWFLRFSSLIFLLDPKFCYQGCRHKEYFGPEEKEVR